MLGLIHLDFRTKIFWVLITDDDSAGCNEISHPCRTLAPHTRILWLSDTRAVVGRNGARSPIINWWNKSRWEQQQQKISENTRLSCSGCWSGLDRAGTVSPPLSRCHHWLLLQPGSHLSSGRRVCWVRTNNTRIKYSYKSWILPEVWPPASAPASIWRTQPGPVWRARWTWLWSSTRPVSGTFSPFNTGTGEDPV